MEVVLLLPVLLFSVVVHEYAHAYVALRQGDPTAYKLGRVTLNPLPHLDLFGSILVPLMLALAPGGLVFGWAKPVPVDPRNFRNYRKGDILVSLAGVASNLVLAVVFTLAAVVLIRLGRALPALATTFGYLGIMASYGIRINLLLAFFNLIPIPPLDGSHVLYHLLPRRLAARYRALGRYGILLLLAILFFGRGLLNYLLAPVFFLDGVARALIELWV